MRGDAALGHAVAVVRKEGEPTVVDVEDNLSRQNGVGVRIL